MTAPGVREIYGGAVDLKNWGGRFLITEIGYVK